MWPINEAALHLWDDEQWDRCRGRYLELARRAGRSPSCPSHSARRAIMLVFAGDLTAASTLIDEQRR